MAMRDMLNLTPPKPSGPIAVRQIVSHDGDLWIVDGAGRLWHGWYSTTQHYVERWTLVNLPEVD